MEKILKIDGGKEIKLRSTARWFKIYREQTGKDALYSVLPVFEALLDLLIGSPDIADKNGQITVDSVIGNLDEGTIVTVFAKLSQLELTDVIAMIWALAKNADDSIPDPDTWADSFEVFPLDTILPEALKLVMSSMVSAKNSKRILETLQTTPESGSKTSSQQA